MAGSGGGTRIASQPFVSVLVLSWNGLDHLKECLPALRAQEDPGVPWEVLVLDNGSGDGSAAWVERHHPEVRLLASSANLGFCGGNNRLVEAAKGEAVVLLNNDTRPAPGWLRELVAAYRGAAGDVAAVSGLIVDWEGRRLDFARGAVTFDGHAFQLGFRTPLEEVELPAAGSELPFACGGNMLIRRSSYLDAGGFDETYFAYLEDVDLGWRLWSGGERVVFAPEAVVRHRSGATSDLLGLFNRGFLFERNAFLTAYKNYEDGLWERMMPGVLLTLQHRTHTLLVENNPGGELLALDPYAGHIANTSGMGGGNGDGEVPSPASAPASSPASPTLAEKWKGYGPREFVRRSLHKLVDVLLPGPAAPGFAPLASAPEEGVSDPVLTDPRTVAQLRAVSHLLGNLDAAAEARRRVQARRRRPDEEILERFPRFVVPTYPGDEELFGSAAFQQWLPEGVPFDWRRLDEVMRLD